MTLRQYEAFLKTVECASVSAAAQALGVSQSALTQLLAGLERDCGFPLLVRNRGGVHLTPAGKALLPAVQQVCAADAHLRGRIQEVRERAGGTIRIATFKSVAVNWLPPMIKQFQVQHPEARFRLFDGAYAEVDAYVRSGTVDMGFISLPSELPGEIVPVCSDRLLAVLPAGHPLAACEAVPVAAFGTEPVVSLIDSTNRDALRVLDAAHVHPDIRFQTADDYAMISMVESGLGICIAHELVLRSDHHNVVVRPLDPPAHRTIAMAIPPESEGKPLVRTFAAFVRVGAGQPVTGNDPAHIKKPGRSDGSVPVFVSGAYAFQVFVCSRSQSAHGSMPSPMSAEIGNT